MKKLSKHIQYEEVSLLYCHLLNPAGEAQHFPHISMAQLWGDAIKDGQGYHSPGLSELQDGFAAGNRRDGVTGLFQVIVEGRWSRRQNFPCFLLDTNISNLISPMTMHSTSHGPSFPHLLPFLLGRMLADD